MVFIPRHSFSWLGKLRMIEPKFPFWQFFDFRFGVDASRFFNLPHPSIQTLHNLRDPRCPSRNSMIRQFRFNSADFLKLGVSNAFVIDETNRNLR